MAAIRIPDFDLWQPGYGLSVVTAYLAGTTTLASLYTDEALSVAAANPQTLLAMTDGGISYGKFSAPLYTGAAFELVIDTVDRTGVIRPLLTTLAAADASAALATASGGSEDFTLAQHLARRIDVRDFGAFVIVGGPGASAATNQATLVAAISAASAAGGGFVEVPPGTYAITGGVTIPTGVVVRGAGRTGTTLQSTLAGNVMVIGGARAGFSRLTLDGVTLVGSSVGLYATNKSEIVLDDVEIKRFVTGIDRRGGTRCNWRELYLSNCTTGYKAYGDNASAAGALLAFNRWAGGKVELCSSIGIDLKYVDLACHHSEFSAITFDSNTGTAVKVTGARDTRLFNCRFTANTANLAIIDASPATAANTVIGVDIVDCEFNTGTIALTGNLEETAFRRSTFLTNTITITSPLHNVHVEDCRENSVTLSGDATAWRRHKTTVHNASVVVTTNASLTKAWSLTLEHGQLVYLEAKVIGRQINGTGRIFHHTAVSARRPGGGLSYETQTGNFTLAYILTGATSGATARIVGDADGGTTGTLTLYDIVGTFADGEIITDGGAGSATVNGTLDDQNAVINTLATLAYDAQSANFTAGASLTGGTSGATATIISDADGGATGTLTVQNINGAFVDNEALTDTSGGAATANGIAQYTANSEIRAIERSDTAYYTIFVADGGAVELHVAGKAAHDIIWTVEVDVTSSFHTRA